MRVRSRISALVLTGVFTVTGWMIPAALAKDKRVANPAPVITNQAVQQSQAAPAQKTPWYKKRATKIVGGGAAGGAVLGGLIGGGKGAAIGAITGGAAGYVYDRKTRK